MTEQTEEAIYICDERNIALYVLRSDKPLRPETALRVHEYLRQELAQPPPRVIVLGPGFTLDRYMPNEPLSSYDQEFCAA